MQNFFASILLKLGEKLIDYLGELFRQWLKDLKDKNDIKDCLDEKSPIKRQKCLNNELNSN